LSAVGIKTKIIVAKFFNAIRRRYCVKLFVGFQTL